MTHHERRNPDFCVLTGLLRDAEKDLDKLKNHKMSDTGKFRLENQIYARIEVTRAQAKQMCDYEIIERVRDTMAHFAEYLHKTYKRKKTDE